MDALSAGSHNFRNYRFREEEGQLQITKVGPRAGIRYKSVVQDGHCGGWTKEYVGHLVLKMTELRDFAPAFTGVGASEQFECWRADKIRKLQEKKDNPLNALQRKVAQRTEELFAEKGARKIILGCMHSSSVLLQTNTDECLLFPRSTLPTECHRHADSVAFDWRGSPEAIGNLDITLGNAIAVPSSRLVDGQGPDFARRNFEIEESFSDLSLIRQVDQVYAERVPSLELGALSCSAKSNRRQLELIRQTLKPGGHYVFDCGLCLFPVVGLDNTDLSKRWQEQAGEERAAFIPRIAPLITKQLKENPTLVQQVSLLMAAGEFAAKSVDSGEVMTEDQTIGALFDAVGAFSAYRKVCAQKYGVWRDAAKHFIDQYPERVLVKPEEIYISWNEPFGRGVRYREARASEFKKGRAPKAFDIFTKPAGLDCLPHIGVRMKEIAFEQQFAIAYQLDLYNAIPVLGDSPDLKYLRPENKALFDTVTKAYVDAVIFPQLKVLGFEKESYEIDAANPENGRRASRLVKVRKPL